MHLSVSLEARDEGRPLLSVLSVANGIFADMFSPRRVLKSASPEITPIARSTSVKSVAHFMLCYLMIKWFNLPPLVNTNAHTQPWACLFLVPV